MRIYEASYQSPGFTQRYKILCIGNTKNIGNIIAFTLYTFTERKTFYSFCKVTHLTQYERARFSDTHILINLKVEIE